MNYYMVNEYIFSQALGGGNFAAVFLGRKKDSNVPIAIKRLERNKPKNEKTFKDEISILRELKHKNIVSLIDFFKTNKHYYIVINYCNGGTLFSCHKKYKEKFGRTFTEEIVQYIMRQIVDAIKYFHGKNIIHRDIKMENILVNFENELDRINLNMLNATIIISDFGISTHIDPLKNIIHLQVLYLIWILRL